MRLISTVVGILILIPVFLFSGTIALNIGVMILSVLAVYEVITVSGYSEKKYLLLPGLLLAALVPFSTLAGRSYFLLIASFLYILYLFCVKVFLSEKVDLNHVIMLGFFTVILPNLFTTIVYTRNLPHGFYYMLAVFFGAWATDIFAYLVGKAIGKHKLSTKISPNKTIEGSVGGVVATVATFVGFGFWVQSVKGLSVNFLLLVVFALISSALAQIGDLSASCIKRHFGVKDFGYIIPGHGGILDRFDSFLFLAPFVYIYAVFLPFLS